MSVYLYHVPIFSLLSHRGLGLNPQRRLAPQVRILATLPRLLRDRSHTVSQAGLVLLNTGAALAAGALATFLVEEPARNWLKADRGSKAVKSNSIANVQNQEVV